MDPVDQRTRRRTVGPYWTAIAGLALMVGLLTMWWLPTWMVLGVVLVGGVVLWAIWALVRAIASPH